MGGEAEFVGGMDGAGVAFVLGGLAVDEALDIGQGFPIDALDRFIAVEGGVRREDDIGTVEELAEPHQLVDPADAIGRPAGDAAMKRVKNLVDDEVGGLAAQGGFFAEHVEPGPADNAGVEGLEQSERVDQAAAGGVDD